MEAVVVRGDCWCWRWCRGAASHSHPASGLGSAPPHGNWGAKLQCCGVLSMRPLAPRHAQCHSHSCAMAPALPPTPHPSPHVCARVGGRVRLRAVGVGPCGLEREGGIGGLVLVG